MAMGKGFRIFHKLPNDRETPYSVIMESKQLEDTLMFESGAVVVLSSQEMDTLKKQYTKVLDAYGCLGVLTLNSGAGLIHYLITVNSCLSVGKIGESEVFKVTGVHFLSLRNDPTDEDRISDLKKLLSSGTFYFSWRAGGDPWDLSLCAQRKLQDHDSDNRFFWNRMLHVHFQRYGIDCKSWLLKVMCGGVEVRTIYAAHRQAKACLISRLSCERAGTRFNVRGVNDDGHVANFVETEQVIFLEDQVVSFIQIRGSIPLFWEQPGVNVGSHKVHMSRGYEAAAPAFDRHLRMVKQQYGNQVIVSLLGCKEGERMLEQAFQNHHKASVHQQDVPFVHFDYHAEIKGSNLKNLENLKTKLAKNLKEFDIFFVADINSGEAQRQQTGTIRTNCLDCLDRTNAVQTMIGLEMLSRQLECLGLVSKPQMVSRFEEVYRQIWAHNGDHISRIYTGTGALGGGRSKYTDATRSASRAIQNNFLDSSKQEAIDVLLTGSALYSDLADKARALLTSRYLHASPCILQSMVERSAEFTRPQPLRVCVATYNVNGGRHFRSIAYKNVSMADWLLDAHKTHPGSMVPGYDYDKPVDIFAVGFEEIVDLNASNIMKASTTNAQEWHKEMLKTISRDHKYVALTHIQLVGVVLFIFIRPQLSPFIRDVAVDKVKTGLGGATGNKGGVGIRFLVHSTSLCFVCAHLAAGQSQVADRNADYVEIVRKMSFPMGRNILSHDHVFWCGDFNYRVDLPQEEVKQQIDSENWSVLQKYDQLNVQRGLNNAFQGFNEGPTNFPPTYKYDMFSDDWDTSEKCRTPAWTDRILWWDRPSPLSGDLTNMVKAQQLLYTRAELRMSDHRPVVSLFEVQAMEVSEERKESVLQEVIGQQGPPDATVIISLASGGEFADEAVTAIVEKFTDVGEVIIIRFVDLDMWVLYKSGHDALDALVYDQQEVAGHLLSVRLKTPSWHAEIERELRLCAANTGQLYNAFTNSLLGDDFSVPSMEFDIGDDEGEEEEEAADGGITRTQPLLPEPFCSSTPTNLREATLEDGNSSNIPSVTPSRPSRPPQPSRPDKPPVRSSSASRSVTDQPLIVCESSVPLRASPSPERQPPQRPGAPPAKPPPPQRPPGGPPKPSPPSLRATSARGSSEVPKIRQPLRPQATTNAKTRKSSPRISSIGLPTNVKHTSHAATPEEAQLLMEMLMRGDSVTSEILLPAPLKPSLSASNLLSDKETDQSSSVPKPLPRSRTTFDMDEDSRVVDGTSTSRPFPTPRARSTDNLLEDRTASKNTSDVLKAAWAPAPQPRPRPSAVKRESPTHDVVANGTAVLSFGTNVKREHLGSESPPPIPSLRPNQRGQSSEIRQQKTESLSQPPPVPNRGPTPSPPVPGNLLDAPNFPLSGISDDPFDVRHVHDPFSTRNVPAHFRQSSPTDLYLSEHHSVQNNFSSATSQPDPFDTSVCSVLPASEPDPFDTSAAVSQLRQLREVDPFEMSKVNFETRSFNSESPVAQRNDLRSHNLTRHDAISPIVGSLSTPPIDNCPRHPPPLLPASTFSSPPPPPPRRDLFQSVVPSASPPAFQPPPIPILSETVRISEFAPPVPGRPGGPPPVPRRPTPH